MKRRLIATVLATLSMMQNAHADIISNLPGFDDVGGGMEFPQPPKEQGADTTTTTTSSTATSTVQRQYTGEVQVRTTLCGTPPRLTESQLEVGFCSH